MILKKNNQTCFFFFLHLGAQTKTVFGLITPKSFAINKHILEKDYGSFNWPKTIHRIIN